MRNLILGAVAGALVTLASVGGTAALAKDKSGDACYVAPAAKEYPGDLAPAGDIAKWMAAGATRAGLPPELPVMAALVESGLKNANLGDSDDAGFFRMRVSIWNQGEYAGFPDRPELQLKWFLDMAIAVKATRTAAGQPTDDPASYGEWVADVQRPAEQFRGRYQLRLEEARQLIAMK